MGERGVQYIKADSVNGFKPESDTYVFKIADDVVAVIPKAKTVSIVKVNRSEDVD